MFDENAKLKEIQKEVLVGGTYILSMDPKLADKLWERLRVKRTDHIIAYVPNPKRLADAALSVLENVNVVYLGDVANRDIIVEWLEDRIGSGCVII